MGDAGSLLLIQRVQAWATVGLLVFTGALVWVTWLYVRISKRQHERMGLQLRVTELQFLLRLHELVYAEEKRLDDEEKTGDDRNHNRFNNGLAIPIDRMKHLVQYAFPMVVGEFDAYMEKRRDEGQREANEGWQKTLSKREPMPPRNLPRS